MNQERLANKNNRRLLCLLFFLAVIGAWHLAVRVAAPSSLIFPGPGDVVMQLFSQINSGELSKHLGVTMYEIVAGFIIGSVLGFLLGVVVEEIEILELLVYPYIVAFQTMPKVAIAPLFIVWFGYGATSKVVITATIAFFPVLANTIVGLRSIPKEQVDLMVAYTASRWQVFKLARLPNALPYVFTGLDVGIVLAVIGAIVGEFVGAQSGLGYLILQKNFSMDTAGVFAILIVLSIIGLVLHWIVRVVAKKVLFWVNMSSNTTGA
ncbi:ABC transporter permease [Pandoraea communis]|uniref:ABC transporter permease n=1 Tax=Pandoraea communis TaxID=2508297 RepID=UPI0025A52EB5|nr:ABC transporter permease [Pandoraea communis]MDM8358060.1 ABC transporter permease [Pandoraea communis]